MSFGFSIGDFIGAVELANKLRRNFAGAPTQFKALSDEVRSLSIVLLDLDVGLSEKDISDQQLGEIRNILDGCYNVLFEIETLLEKNLELESSDRRLANRARRVWKKVNWRPEDVHELRNRLTSHITMLNAFVCRISSESILGTRKVVDLLHQRQTDQDRLDILNWLTPADYTPQQHDHLNRRQDGTGQWLLDSPEYTTWKQEIGETLLCRGIPGAGKTILTSLVIDNLRKSFQGNQGVSIAYVYCDFRRQGEQTIGHLLSTILKQLAETQYPLPKCLTDLFDEHKTMRTRPMLDEISTSIRYIVGKCTRAFIVVDALDECSTSDGCRAKLMSELISQQTKYHVNIFVTSRFIPEIIESFPKSITLEISAVDGDILRYLRERFFQLPTFARNNADLKDEIAMGITKAASGMFLLAQLYMDSLQGKRSPKALRIATENLATGPNPYKQVYHDAMERIRCQLPDEKDLAMQALAWIICARRTLTTAELQLALAVEPGQPRLDEDNISRIEDIISVCAGLITVDEESDIVRLVHYTALDYFEQVRVHWFPDAEADITEICLTYISFSEFNSGPCCTDEEYEMRLLSHQLYSYAACNWGYHARAAATQSRIVQSFTGNQSAVDAASQAMIVTRQGSWDMGYSQRYPTKMTHLHLVAYFGLQSSIDELLSSGSVDVPDGNGQSPLSWAARNGHEAVARLLLDNAADFQSKDTYGLTPFSWAAGRGHDNVVKLLLNNGADFNSPDTYGRTPLSWAARHGHEGIVKLLLQHGADCTSQDEYDRTALTWAAYNGHEAIVKLLVDKGGDVNSHSNGSGPTALGWAASKGHTAVVTLLIEKGADINHDEIHHQTVLGWAVQNGHKAITELLMKKGADINLQNRNGQAPLSLAAENGHVAIAKVLLEKGAHVDTQDEYGCTPLSWAAGHGHEAIVELLLENGAKVDSHVEGFHQTPFSCTDRANDKDVGSQRRDSILGYGQTPLSSSARYGYGGIAILLLDKGADGNSRDKDGLTPLSWATRQGHRSTVKLLLSNGAKVDLEDKYGRTPLGWAARDGHDAYIVELLLEHGADVDWHDIHDQTPVSLAEACGHGTILQLLLDKGTQSRT